MNNTPNNSTLKNLYLDPQLIARLNDAEFFGCLQDVLEVLREGTSFEELDAILEHAQYLFELEYQDELELGELEIELADTQHQHIRPITDNNPREKTRKEKNRAINS